MSSPVPSRSSRTWSARTSQALDPTLPTFSRQYQNSLPPPPTSSLPSPPTTQPPLSPASAPDTHHPPSPPHCLPRSTTIKTHNQHTSHPHQHLTCHLHLHRTWQVQLPQHCHQHLWGWSMTTSLLLTTITSWACQYRSLKIIWRQRCSSSRCSPLQHLRSGRWVCIPGLVLQLCASLFSLPLKHLIFFSPMLLQTIYSLTASWQLVASICVCASQVQLLGHCLLLNNSIMSLAFHPCLCVLVIFISLNMWTILGFSCAIGFLIFFLSCCITPIKLQYPSHHLSDKLF